MSIAAVLDRTVVDHLVRRMTAAQRVIDARTVAAEERNRAVVELYTRHGWTLQRIADALGITAQAVHKIVVKETR